MAQASARVDEERAKAVEAAVAPRNDNAPAAETTPADAAPEAKADAPATPQSSEVAPAAAPQPGALATQDGPVIDGEAKPARSRKKAGIFALFLVLLLGAFIAWYPLSDRYAPYAGAGSIVAEVTQISARVPGPVAEVAIKDNAEVTAGEMLFRIDDTTYRMDVELARAQLDTVLNSVNSGAAALPATQAKVEQAQLALTTAIGDYERARSLEAKGVVSAVRLTQAETARANAELNLAAATAELERVETSMGGIDANNPNIRSARASLEKAEFALASTTVVAPADGYVTNVALTEGQYVGAGTGALTFIRPSTQMIMADFRENQLINVEPGDRALVTFEAAPGKQFEATIDSIAWGINAGRTSANGLAQPTTDTRWFPPARKIPVRVTLNDPSELPANARLGSEAGVMVIPEDGIIPAIARALLSFGGFTSGFN